MMTEDQKDEINETLAYVRGVLDVLEMHELQLRNFDKVKADPNDPYSIDTIDVADGLSLARDNLTDTLELLEAFNNPVNPV